MTIRETPQRKEKKNKMTFGEALKKMEAGAFVAREGWNGQNQFIFMTEGSIPDVQDLRGRAKAAANYARRTMGPLLHDGPTGQEVVVIHPHIDMFTERRTMVCGWLASQTDMTATDWYVRDYAQNNQEPEEEKCYGCKWAKWLDEETCECNRDGKVPFKGCWEPERMEPHVAPKEPDFPWCPYNNTGRFRFCINREKNRCKSSGSYCFKQGMELKEKEDGTQSN